MRKSDLIKLNSGVYRKGNKNYRKGYNMERAVVQMCRKAGWIAQRTAGSHSPIDVIAINPKDMSIKLFQCKNQIMGEKAQNSEVWFLKNIGLHSVYKIQVFLAYKEKGHKGFKLRVV